MPGVPRIPPTVRSVLAVLATVPVLITWPLARVFDSHVLAAADQEAAPHIWGLWAAGQTGSLLQIETSLQAFPDGIELVLVDPFNLPMFHLGALLGPAAGYNLVLWSSFIWMGIAGALLAREWDAPPWLGAVAAMACPTLIANAADGMTEGFGVGLVGIFAALLVRGVRTNSPRAWVGAAVLLGLTPWTGPYNAVWAALIGLGMAAALAINRDTAALKRTALVGLTGALAGLPVGWSIFQSRSDALPGGAERAGLPQIVENPDIFRGGVHTGADLLDPFLPVQLTGAEAPISHTAYQGIVLIVCAAVVARRQPSARRWLLGAVCFILLSFGPWLYLQGEVLQLGGASLAGPAGMAMLALPVLGRITRWYRAGAVAGLLLAPLAARLARTRAQQFLLAAALLLDALVCAPLAWPLHHSPLPAMEPLRTLEDGGALLELPPVTSGEPPPGAWRDLSALAQVQHGRPVGGAMMGLGVSSDARSGTEAIRALLRSGTLEASDHEAIRNTGFRFLVIHSQHHPLPEGARAHLSDCFGEAVIDTASLLVHDAGVPGSKAGCVATRPVGGAGFDSHPGAK